MTEKEKMLAGQYYRPSAPGLRKDREVALKNMQAFNNEDNSSKRNVILQKWFGATGKSIPIWNNVLSAIMVVIFMLVKTSTPILTKLS